MLSQAKEQGWLAEGATVGAESDAVIALAKAKENAKKPASGIDDGEEEDNSIQVSPSYTSTHTRTEKPL